MIAFSSFPNLLIVIVSSILTLFIGFTPIAFAKEKLLSIGFDDAPIEMIVFFDYGTPHIHMFWDDTYPSLYEKYIETGKVKLVLRPYPLFFPEENSTINLIECVHDQSEEIARSLVDTIFTSTTSLTDIDERENSIWAILSNDSQIDQDRLNICDARGEFGYRIDQNRSEGEMYDVNGFPHFILKTKSKTERITGAKAKIHFTETIDSLLRAEQQYGFIDVPRNYDHFDAITYAQSKGIVSGYPNGKFRPNSPINRAEFTKIIIEAIQILKQAHGIDAFDEFASCSQQPFSDTPLGVWYTPYLCKAKEKKIIDGYLDRTFKPDQNINFAEASKIVTKGFGVIATGKYKDPWYRPYIEFLSQNRAIPPEIQDVNQLVTRGQMAEIIYRILGNRKKSSKQYSDFIDHSRADLTIDYWGDIADVEMGIKNGLLDSNHIPFSVAHPSQKFGPSARHFDNNIVRINLISVEDNFLFANINGQEVMMAGEAFYKLSFADGFAILIAAMDIEQSIPSDFIIVRFND